MSITLQGTVAFDLEFIAELPRLTRAMADAGLDPAGFVISKDSAASPAMPVIGPFYFDYTVFLENAYFTVTEPNDARFLDFLLARIRNCELSPETSLQPSSPPAPSSMLARLTSWLSQPV
jgi:hypothetical protein